MRPQPYWLIGVKGIRKLCLKNFKPGTNSNVSVVDHAKELGISLTYDGLSNTSGKYLPVTRRKVPTGDLTSNRSERFELGSQSEVLKTANVEILTVTQEQAPDALRSSLSLRPFGTDGLYAALTYRKRFCKV